MPSAVATIGIPSNLEQVIPQLDAALVPHEARKQLLARSFELRSGRERPGRFWKIDIDALDYSALSVPAFAPVTITGAEGSRVIATDLQSALRTHREIVERVSGTVVDAALEKFAALAAALRNTGAFIFVPADTAVDSPIEITYDASSGALFPYTLVVLERGAQCTIIERVTGGSSAFVCGVTEIITAENATATYAAEQTLPGDGRAFFTRAAKPGKDGRVNWAVAELGAQLSVTSVQVAIEDSGVQADIAGIFFPRDDQHVDLITNVDHTVGHSFSETVVKSAATGRGQARYVGNIRIVQNAQGTDSSLRDDALLLSQKAHIDSIPALEIGANDVKAYHGATVGAIDEEQIFYMTSRGIERQAAEKMIALGFFEPAVARFPGETLRERLRAALEEKVRS